MKPGAIIVGVLLGGIAGCREPTVGVRLVFPAEEAFLLSNTISVDVYDGGGSGETSPDAICRALSVESAVAPAGVQPLKSAANTAACGVLDGGVSFDDLSVGRRVFFAEAADLQGVPILRGCTVADIFGDDDEGLAGEAAEDASSLGANAIVNVQLATLPSYPDGVTPLCEDITAKCEENKPCVN
jgi:hypothetical protein